MVVGWDEVLHGDVPQNVIGMSWRMSAEGGAAETQPNHNRDSTVRSKPYVFLRPNKHCLYRKSLNPD